MSDHTMARGHRSPTRQAADAGFTLLEIMVALLVLSMIVTSAFGTLRLGQRSWQAGVEKATATEDQRTVKELLRRQFSQILPLSRKLDGKERIAFEGDARRVRFIAPAPQHHGSTGLFEYTLVLEPLADSARLVLYYLLHDPDSTGLQEGGSDRQRVLLVEELKTASFSYYGSPVVGEPPQWHSQWNNDAETFPQLVRVGLTSKQGQRPWPELVLALHTDLKK